NPIIMILLTPIRMFYFIASPLPWDWRSFSDIFAFMFSSLFYIITIFFGIRSLNIKNTDYKNLNIILLIILLISMIFFSLVVLFFYLSFTLGFDKFLRYIFIYV